MVREHPAISDVQLRAAYILVQHDFSNSLAASLLHVNRTTLTYWLKKFRTRLQWEQLQRQLCQQELQLQQEEELRQVQAQAPLSTLTMQQEKLHAQQHQVSHQLHAQLQWQQQQLLQQLARLQQQQQVEHQQLAQQRAQLDELLGQNKESDEEKQNDGGDEERSVDVVNQQVDNSDAQAVGRNEEQNEECGDQDAEQVEEQKSDNGNGNHERENGSGEDDVDMDQGSGGSALLSTQDGSDGGQDANSLAMSSDSTGD